MPEPTYQQILKSLHAHTHLPCYFFQGAGTYHVDKLVDYIEHRFIPPAHRTLNLKVFYGKEQRLLDILDLARAYPMLPGSQVLLVKEAHLLKGLQQVDGGNALIKYINQPNPRTLLVFVYAPKRLDARKRLFKQLQKQKMIFTSKPLAPAKVPDWLVKKAQEQGFQLTLEAAVAFQTIVGDDLALLDKELEKIVQSVEAGKQINRAHIQAHASRQRTFTVLDLQEALLNQDTKQTARVATYLIQNPQELPAPKLIAFLYAMYVQLLQLHAAPADREKIPLHPFVKQKYLKKINQFSVDKLRGNLQALHQSDRALKGDLKRAYTYEELLCDLLAKLS